METLPLEQASATPTSRSTSSSETTPQPEFSREVYFSYDPDPVRTQRIFPGGVKQVFAIWNYANMRQGLKVRKVWYKDARVWFYQDEVWDFNRYGATGTISDATLYDLEKGLSAGTYWLRLYIEGIEQTSAANIEQSAFKVLDKTLPDRLPSPDGAWNLYFQDPRTMIIQSAEAVRNIISSPLEIASAAWFPDSRQVLLALRDRTKQSFDGSATGIRDELWMITPESGVRTRISTPEENLHIPSISPSGQYIVAVAGTGQFSACQADLTLTVIELDENYNRIALQKLENFSGLPKIDQKPYPYNHPLAPMPGKWLDENQIVIALKFPCTPGEHDGIYLLNLQTLQVTKSP